MPSFQLEAQKSKNRTVMMKEPNNTKMTTATPGLHRLRAFVMAALSSRKTIVGALVVLLGTGLAALAADNRAPEVPDDIAVGDTNKVHFHGFGVGVQIYTWDGVKWAGPVPDATLFDNDGNIVATHFAGPRWKSNSGSIVLGAAVLPTVTVDTNAIPWVRLKAVTTEGPGVFADTTFIQRVHTVGGLPPKENGAFIGQVVKSPYTADYFFYRASN
jgi:hypothetical protein